MRSKNNSRRCQYFLSLLLCSVLLSGAFSRLVSTLGYFDQPHLTRSLPRFIGQTPAQITQGQNQLAFLYKTDSAAEPKVPPEGAIWNSFAGGGFRWMYLLAESEFPSFPVTGKDGNPTLVFFRRLFPEKRLQKSYGSEMMIESKLGA
jgi:hypothetical protein